MSSTVSTRVVWLTVVFFLLVNGAIIGRQVLARRRGVPARTETAPMVLYGDRVAWSGHDILGRPIVIPCDTADVLIVEVDLSKGREALEYVRLLSGGVPGGGRPRLVRVIASTGTAGDQATLAGLVGKSARVVDRRQMDAILGGVPGRFGSRGLVVVRNDTTVGLCLHGVQPRDVQALLTQWYDWRWNP